MMRHGVVFQMLPAVLLAGTNHAPRVCVLIPAVHKNGLSAKMVPPPATRNREPMYDSCVDAASGVRPRSNLSKPPLSHDPRPLRNQTALIGDSESAGRASGDEVEPIFSSCQSPRHDGRVPQNRESRLPPRSRPIALLHRPLSFPAAREYRPTMPRAIQHFHPHWSCSHFARNVGATCDGSRLSRSSSLKKSNGDRFSIETSTPAWPEPQPRPPPAPLTDLHMCSFAQPHQASKCARWIARLRTPSRVRSLDWSTAFVGHAAAQRCVTLTLGVNRDRQPEPGRLDQTFDSA